MKTMLLILALATTTSMLLAISLKFGAAEHNSIASNNGTTSWATVGKKFR